MGGGAGNYGNDDEIPGSRFRGPKMAKRPKKVAPKAINNLQREMQMADAADRLTFKKEQDLNDSLVYGNGQHKFNDDDDYDDYLDL